MLTERGTDSVGPGPDGGTCINEAALVAAGFEYQSIVHVGQMPRCFSRPICRLAMRLNDHATEAERQRLLLFVTRLACADTPEIERQREAYIGARLPMAQLVMGKVSFETGVEVLEGALAIGRQADPLAPEVARTRMDAARREATDVSPVRDDTLFGKVKAWFTAAKVPEPAD